MIEPENLCCKVLFLFCALCTQQFAAQEATFDCDTTYYADVNGLTIRCYSFPVYESKHLACFKDLWWKFLVFGIWEQPPLYDASPFNILHDEVCQSKCRCVIEFNFVDFSCTTRGRPPAWSNELSLQLRSGAYCRDLALPKALSQNMDRIVLSAVFSFVGETKERTVLLSDLAQALSDIGIDALEINSWSFANNLAAVQPPMTALDGFFQPYLLKRLVSLSIGGGAPGTYKYNVAWPSLESAMQNVTESVKFFTLNSFNISAIPKPQFAKNLLGLTCVRCFRLDEAPVWIKDSRNLLFLHLSNVPENFPLDDMPPLLSLLHFSFTECPLKRLPDNFSISLLYPNLENLDLNTLDLSVIPNNSVQNLKNLRRLDLSGNNLTPLPSFRGLQNLRLLLLDGVSLIYGSDRNSYSALYGRGANGSPIYKSINKTLVLQQDDLRDLANLETLSMSYYQNLQINDNAFDNLRRLKSFSMNGVKNLTRFPNALRCTCNLKTIYANSNPYTGQGNKADPDSWLIPLFVPKFYKSLEVLDMTWSNIPIAPPSLFLFNVSRKSPLFQWFTYSISTNPVYSNSCEMYKFATAYTIQPPMEASANISAPCYGEYIEATSIAKKVWNDVVDYCLRSAGTARKMPSVKLTGILLVYVLKK